MTRTTRNQVLKLLAYSAELDKQRKHAEALAVYQLATEEARNA